MKDKPTEKSSVITRFAPSPTGQLHIGSARTALFNYLFTKKLNGQIILRIDDTDPDRSRPEYEADIKDGLKWLGLEFDAVYYQSKRSDIYRRQLEKLIQSKRAYWSKETPPSAVGRKEVIRFKNPGEKITFTDLIRGPVTFDTTELGDFVVAKDLSSPVYHLASVIDDHNLGITHIIRGEDHISNTPRQILIAEALGAKPPTYAHIPLILSPERSKLSKRHGATAITNYRDQGYRPEAIINFLALLGWSPQKAGIIDQEVFTLTELTEFFDINKAQKSGAIFNIEKLNWLNREHLKRLPEAEFLAEVERRLPEQIKTRPLYSKERLKNMKDVLLERITVFGDIEIMAAGGEIDYFFDLPQIDHIMLGNTKYLKAVADRLEKIPAQDFKPEKIKAALWDFATERGRGEVLWPFRVALTGRKKSPDPFTVAAIIGRQETLARIKSAIS